MAARKALLGRIAVHNKLITLEQLRDATALQAKFPQKKLGEILVAKGYVSERQLRQLLVAQQRYLERQRSKDDDEGEGASEPPPSSERAGRATVTAEPAPRRPRADTGRYRQRVPSDLVNEAPGGGLDKQDWLRSMLTHAAGTRASDILILPGASAKLRRFGMLFDLTERPLSPAATQRILHGCLNEAELHRLEEDGEVDLAYQVEGSRFRANIYKQFRGYSGVFHTIPETPPTLDELGLPTSIAKFTSYSQGLILATGPAGCGKTSTIAALLNIINEERTDHIITIEDPIEYLHPSRRSIVNQREVKRHTHSFANALRSALREDPDVICIGELRDLETISLALTAAETGHLVLGTLHTGSSIRTINRILGAYPPRQQDHIRIMLSESLRAVISQRLIPSVDGNSVALACELLFVNNAVGALIRDNRTFQIHSVLQTGRAHGMQLLDDSLRELVSSGRITREAAASHAENPKHFDS